MRRILVGLALLTITACAGSPTAPSQPAPVPPAPTLKASIGMTGRLTYSNCVQVNGPIFRCDFEGTAINVGDGCATHVAGVTRIWQTSLTDTPLSTTAWTYSAIVRPAENFSYRGNALAASEGAGYVTEFTFDTVSCP